MGAAERSTRSCYVVGADSRLSLVNHGVVPLIKVNTLIDYEQYTLLKTEAGRSSLSMAELIRRAIDKTYRPNSRPRVMGLEVNFGIWRRPDAAVLGRLRERFFG